MSIPQHPETAKLLFEVLRRVEQGTWLASEAAVGFYDSEGGPFEYRQNTWLLRTDDQLSVVRVMPAPWEAQTIEISHWANRRLGVHVTRPETLFTSLPKMGPRDYDLGYFWRTTPREIDLVTERVATLFAEIVSVRHHFETFKMKLFDFSKWEKPKK